MPHVSPYSGHWYPSDAGKLRRLQDDLSESSERRTGSCLLPGAVGFVVPHAAPIYSGRVSAAAYRHLGRQKPERVFVLGFNHAGSPPGLWIPDVDGFRTPLGDVAVDRDSVRALVAEGPFRLMPEDLLCDHSVELQLPFLQVFVPGVRLTPIYVSRPERDLLRRGAEKLAKMLTPGSVAIASSDLTHYGKHFHFQPFPPDSEVFHRLHAMDSEVIASAGTLEGSAFSEALQETGSTVCGRDPIALLLAAMRELPGHADIFQQTLDYETSGEITGERRHSVSYAALGYFPWSSFQLGPEDGARLLESARRTLAHYQQTGKSPALPAEGRGESLERRASAFVTLWREGMLRGCLGRIPSSGPLRSLIPELTLAAALDDFRFEPVHRSEAGIEIEISVLSPMKRLTDLSRFRVGLDGGELRAGSSRGVLLPQAAGAGWTAERFLRELARKAEVGEDVYSDRSASLSIFRVQSIH